MSKNNKEVKTQNSPKPVKKLKPISQENKKPAEPEKKTPAKKKIVIGELPDYEAFMKQEAEKEKAEKEAEKKKQEENKKKETKKTPEKVKQSQSKYRPNEEYKQTPEKKTDKPEKEKQDTKKSDAPVKKEESKPEKKKQGLFDRIKDMMYASAEDDEEEETEEDDDTEDVAEEVVAPEPEPEEETDEEEPEEDDNDDEDDGEFFIEELEENDTSDTSEEIPEITDDSEDDDVVDDEEEEDFTEEDDEEEKETKKPEKPVKAGAPVIAQGGKYNVISLVCVILAIVGVIAIISTCISKIGGKNSSKDKFAKAVYPAVIVDVNEFSNPSEIPNDQIINATIWSVILDDSKISKYAQIVDSVNIPVADIEKYANELFGNDIPALNHTTVGSAEVRFYYNSEAQSYNVPVSPDVFTYSPEVKEVSKKNGASVVKIDYIEEHPEWHKKSVAKSAQYTLSKNDNDGYKIDSMKIVPTEEK